MKFSPDLSSRLVNYFTSRHHIALSEPQIEEFLTALADLYGSFAEDGEARLSAPAARPQVYVTPVERCKSRQKYD